MPKERLHGRRFENTDGVEKYAMTEQEIADKLGWPQCTVHVTLKRALKKLRNDPGAMELLKEIVRAQGRKTFFSKY